MELSNLNTILYKLIGLAILSVVVVLTLVGDYFIYSITNEYLGGFPFPGSFISLLVGLIIYYVLFGQYHKVEFDDSKLYYSNLFSKKEISLKEIAKVSMGRIPYSCFIYVTYPITIKFKNGGRIRCMSSEVYLLSDKEEIKEYKILKGKIDLNNNR